MANLLSGRTALRCPARTRMHILNLGTLQGDEGLPIHGQHMDRPRDLLDLAALIEHPEIGLILFDTGRAENEQILSPPPSNDVFPRKANNEEHRLPATIKEAGYDIEDVKAVILSHLHLDHAGGLEHFFGTDVPIHVHEDEFQHACMAAATRTDNGAYSAEYMDFSKLNWQTFFDDRFEIAQGIIMHLAPGHTPGLCVVQVNLEKDGTFVFTSDMYHIAENYQMSGPVSWLVKDQNAWLRSHRMIKHIERLFQARMVFGHDKRTAETLMAEKPFFE